MRDAISGSEIPAIVDSRCCSRSYKLAEPPPFGEVIQRKREKNLPRVISYIHSPAFSVLQEVWLLFPDFLESLEDLGSQITRGLNLESIGVGNFSKVADEMEIQSHW
jgi:hypothetical protein